MESDIMHKFVSFSGVLLGAWIPLIAARAEQPAIVVSDPVNLATVCDAKASDEGVHGGTQSRICRTSHGTYAAFLGKDAEGKTVIHVIRTRQGRPERLASLPTTLSGSNSVHVVCDADQEVYLIAPGSDYANGGERAQLSAQHVDRHTGGMTEYRATVPFGRGNGYGYGSVFLDAPRKAIYALYSGGDAPGYFAWVRFDLAEKRWATEAVVADLPYRHCYNYGFGDGRGGFAVLSERDVRLEAVGVSPTDPGRDPGTKYVWDELRLFRFPDLTRGEYRAVDVETAVYDKPAGLYPGVQNNYGGDTFIDAQGRMHILYRSTDNNRIKGAFNRHAVLDGDGPVVSNELLPFQDATSMRMVQSTEGRHFILATPYNQPARVQVWSAVDAEGSRFELQTEKRLADEITPSYAGLAISCPRNGSIRDDVVDCLLPSGRTFHTFSVRLK